MTTPERAERVVLASSKARASGQIWVRARAIILFIWREHRALLTVAAAFVGTMTVVGSLVGWHGPVGLRRYFNTLGYLTPVVLIPAALITVWRYRHRYHMSGSALPLHRAWYAAARDCWQRDVTLERALSYALALTLTALVLGTYTGWKHIYPSVAPFAWDVTFMHADRLLHFGRLPHEWLAPVLARPRLLVAWDRLYMISWFFMLVAVWVLIAASGPSPLRRQFFLANALVWVLLGVVMATALSSAGPWAYGAVVGAADPYAGLMQTLREVDGTSTMKAIRAQTWLWDIYTGGYAIPGSGISAMPSLHIAMVTLVALASWRVSRVLGALATVYALAMLVGSVLSGMHYAVDGYVAAVGTWLIWRLSGRLVAAP